MNTTLGVIAALLLFVIAWLLAIAIIPTGVHFPLGALVIVIACRFGDAVLDWSE